MQLNLVVFCFLAILVNVAVSTEERKQQGNFHSDSPIVQQDHKWSGNKWDGDKWDKDKWDGDKGDKGDKDKWDGDKWDGDKWDTDKWDGDKWDKWDGDKGEKDKCLREHPLIKKGIKQVPFEFKRYNIVPDLIPEPPALLLEVYLCVCVPAWRVWLPVESFVLCALLLI